MRAFSHCSTQVLSRFCVSSISASRRWNETAAGAGDKPAEKEKNPEIPNTDISNLEEKLAKATEEIVQLKKDILYRAAEADNARRIGREDVDKAKLYGITSFGKDMLEVADTLEKGVEAFSKIPEDELKNNKNLNSILIGVKLSIKVLQKNLGKHGIEKMVLSKGDRFDPNLHEALARLPASPDTPNDTIAEILKQGYKIKERILRAAQVAVASDN